MQGDGERTGRAWRVLTLAVPAVFLTVFFVWPVGTIVVTPLVDGDGLATVAEVLGDSRTWDIAWFTTWQAIASTVLTVVVGIPGAWVASRVRFRGRLLFRSAVTVPFVLPTVVVGTAFLGLLGRGSPLTAGIATVLGLDRSPDLTSGVAALLVAHVFFNYAVVVRTVGARWSSIDPRSEEAARLLGASPLRAFREVTWPRLRPAVAAAAAIVFLFTFTSFGVVLILGDGRLATLEVEIYRTTAQLLDLPTASVLALLQMAAVVASLVVHGRLSRGIDGRERLARQAATLRRPTGRGERTLFTAVLVGSAVLVGAPILALLERSLRVGDGYGLRWFTSLGETTGILFVPPTEAITNSLVFGAGAALVALVVGGLAAVAATSGGRAGALMDRALMVPLGTSAVTLGFGFLITLDSPPLDLRSSPLLIPLAQGLVAIPFVVRAMVPALRSIDPRLRQAATMLGADPRQVRRHVDLPIVFRAATVAAGFAYAVSLGEFGATSFIARGDRPTLPIAIFRLLGQPGAMNVGRAMAMSVILMLVVMAVTATVDRLRIGELGAF